MDKKTKHGHSSSSGRSPTYRSWHSMKQRAKNPKAKGAANYSLRGIDMDPRWESFQAFLADMGERPEGTSLDRVDNSLGYWPNNCRWATPEQQLCNRRNNVFIEHDGKRLTLSQWSALTGIPFTTLRLRHLNKWPVEKLLSPARFAKNQFT